MASWGATYVRGLSKASAEDLISAHFHAGWRDTYIGLLWRCLVVNQTINLTNKLSLISEGQGLFTLLKKES